MIRKPKNLPPGSPRFDKDMSQEHYIHFLEEMLRDNNIDISDAKIKELQSKDNIWRFLSEKKDWLRDTIHWNRKIFETNDVKVTRKRNRKNQEHFDYTITINDSPICIPCGKPGDNTLTRLPYYTEEDQSDNDQHTYDENGNEEL